MRRVLIPLVLSLGLPAASFAGLSAPVPVAPASVGPFASPPAFGWKPVAGADKYGVQVAADANFDSPVQLNGTSAYETRNTWATLKKSLPNGTYYWRVHSITKDGSLSPWSTPREFRKLWLGQTTPISPTDGATVSYPSPVTLRWTPIEGAAKYLFTLASDADLASLDGETAKPVETDASAATITHALSPRQTYYWSVTPVDAEGLHGTPSATWSFTWQWPSVTNLHYEDLAPSTDVVDPRFSWDAVPGAARYEVEINADADFAPGSKFCCSATTVATVLSPKTVLLNNRYYWRVRAIDADGHFGDWNVWGDGAGNAWFRKTFDTRDPGDPTFSINDLRLVDRNGDTLPSSLTDMPILTWEPVIGASAYEVEVRRWTGAVCTDAYEYWYTRVATNAWTPLGPQTTGDPWQNASRAPTTELPQLVAGNQYCVRVRAQTDKGKDATGTTRDVFGDWTYLVGDLDPGVGLVSFEFAGYPDDPCVAPCPTPPYPAASDYGLPLDGSTPTRAPYFTWTPTPYAKSYFVIISRDANFTTLVDYAFVRGPAYAPRLRTEPVTLADETTAYYWAVLPATDTLGHFSLNDPLQASPPSFDKASEPPALLEPSHGAVFSGKPTFRWTLAEGARTYKLEVATDSRFSANDIVESITTASTSYTPDTNYPADKDLFWRVRAVDWNGVGLKRSAVDTLKKTLGTPVPIGSTATSESIPTCSWAPVAGAVSYDFEVQQPDGQVKTFNGFRASAITFAKLDGTGVWKWRVRAAFPTPLAGQVVRGPWSTLQTFTNKMSSPTGAATPSGKNGVLFAWNRKIGATHYQVEVSNRADFSGALVERIKIDNPTYAPLLSSGAYNAGGKMWWRVAAIDESGNIGETTKPLSFILPPRLKIAVVGLAQRGKSGKITVTVTDFSGHVIKGARVSISGPGVRRSGKTNKLGKYTVTVRPRKADKLTITVTRSGYQGSSYVLAVR